MDDFELEIKKDFIGEALMNLEETEGSFMELESSADPKLLLDKIFRLAHNLKGGSRAVGFGDVAEFTHQLENLVLKIQQGQVVLSPAIITTLLRSNDRLTEMLTKIKANMSATFDNADLLAEIQACLDGKAPEATPAESAPSPVEEVAASASEESVDPITETPVSADLPPANAFFSEAEMATPVADEETKPSSIVPMTQESAPAETMAASPAASAPDKTAAAPKEKAKEATKENPAAKDSGSGSGSGGNKAPKDDEVVRVNLSRIELLNDYVGELIVAQSLVSQQEGNQVSAKMRTSIAQMVKISKDIQNLSMSLRMLPVKPLVQKLQRVVRDTALLLKREVQLDVIGEGLDVDKSVLDRLADPLIHILRNAVDHGLEDTQDRVKKGKPAKGRVQLSFINEGNHLVVEIKDDGNGINAEVIRKKAIEKKLISESQPVTEKQLIHLIFHPGFSTKAVTSETSGRGVGMDVVKTNVDKMGGKIEITTVVGSGSVFRLKIPLSLAVIEGWVVEAVGARYVVPASQIQETVCVSSSKLYSDKTGIGTCIDLRGSVIPLFDLNSVLGLKSAPVQPEDTVLIISVNDQLLGLVVKNIVQSQQVVIKPVGIGIRPQKGWIGSCVLGDGLPTLIVSPFDLLEGRVTLNQAAYETRGAA